MPAFSGKNGKQLLDRIAELILGLPALVELRFGRRAKFTHSFFDAVGLRHSSPSVTNLASGWTARQPVDFVVQ